MTDVFIHDHARTARAVLLNAGYAHAADRLARACGPRFTPSAWLRSTAAKVAECTA